MTDQAIKEAKERDLLNDIHNLLNEINYYGYNLTLETKGIMYHISLNESCHCLNGHWGKENLQRMYDQTSGYLQCLRNHRGGVLNGHETD